MGGLSRPPARSGPLLPCRANPSRCDGLFPTVGTVIEVQDVALDPEARRVWRGGREVVLSRMEFDLLHALIQRPGEVVTREELMQRVWGATFWTSSKTIDVHLGWVRRKLGDDSRNPMLISTIRGRGLRFELGKQPATEGAVAEG